ncbi:hypothetical protein [Streptomyces sp. NPDC002788]
MGDLRGADHLRGYEADYEVRPIEAYVRDENGRYLDGWCNRLRDAYLATSSGETPSKSRTPAPKITACRHDKLTAHLRAVGLGTIADLGFVGLDDSGPEPTRR